MTEERVRSDDTDLSAYGMEAICERHAVPGSQPEWLAVVLNGDEVEGVFSITEQGRDGGIIKYLLDHDKSDRLVLVSAGVAMIAEGESYFRLAQKYGLKMDDFDIKAKGMGGGSPGFGSGGLLHRKEGETDE